MAFVGSWLRVLPLRTEVRRADREELKPFVAWHACALAINGALHPNDTVDNIEVFDSLFTEMSHSRVTMTSPRETWQVPSFVTHQYRPKATDYCVCVFVINENGKLHKQLEKMQPYAAVADVVVADGGSTDGSTERAVLEPLGVNTLLVKTGAGKLGAQMRMAFAWAMDCGYKGVVCIDGNGKDGTDAIPQFVQKLDEGYDHVQGSRFIPGGVSENLPLSRWLGLKLLHSPLISLASGYRYTDTTNGFRGYSRRLLEDPSVSTFRDVFTGYELHYYLAIRAARIGFRVCEIPVARRYPSHGPVPTKISPIRGNLRVLKCLFAACLGRYNK